MPASPRPTALAPAVLFVAALFAAGSTGSAVAQIPGLPEGLQLPEGVQPAEPPEDPAPPKAVWTGTVDDRVTALAFSPDGKTLAVGTFEAVELRDAADGEAIRTLNTRAGFVESLLWLEPPAGEEPALTVGDYRRVTRWNPETGRGLSRTTGPRGYVTGMVAVESPDGTRALIVAAEDGTVRRWPNWGTGGGTDDAAGEPIVVQPLGAEARVPVRGLAGHGERLVAAFGDPDRDTKAGPVFLLDAATLETLFPLPEHVRAAECATFSAGGGYVLSGGADEVGRLSHLPALEDARYVTGRADDDPEPIGRYAGHARPVNAALALPAPESEVTDLAPLFATGSGGRAKDGNELRVWRFEPTASDDANGDDAAGGEGDGPTGKVRNLTAVSDFAAPVRSLALSADGARLAVGDDSGAVRVYRIADLLGESSDEQSTGEAPAARDPLVAPKPVREDQR